MKLLVTGVTRYGNLGGVAMLSAIEDVVRDQEAEIKLLSILPDTTNDVDEGCKLKVVYADYRLWLCCIIPLLLLLWPFREIKFIKLLASNLPIAREFSDADLIFDVSGISFVDGRGIALLYYNFSLLFPAVFFNKPLHKLSQALGPFKTPTNRFVANQILPKCTSIAARGQQSLEHLKNLELKNCFFSPDISFAMVVQQEKYSQAELQCRKMVPFFKEKNLVIIAPSAVVENYCNKNGIDFLKIIDEVIDYLHSNDNQVALLAHSTDTGIKKNDDMSIVANIKKNYSKSILPILETHGDPRLARALISQGDLFIASRFHAMIGALSQATPVITIGWSHKYKEAAGPFHMSENVIDFMELKDMKLKNKIDFVLQNKNTLKKTMKPIASKMCSSSKHAIKSIILNMES